MSRRSSSAEGRTAVWIGLYLILAVGPLGVVALSAEELPSRGCWIEFSAALGFMGLAMLALQFVLTARFKRIGAPHGLDTIIQFHREAGLVAVTFILAHPMIIILGEPAYLEYIDPRVMAGRAILLIAAIAALILIVVLTFWRQPLGISYEWWRLSHGLLGVFVVVAGLIHVFQVNWYVSAAWQKALWVALTGAALLLLAHVRIGKPIRMLTRPYRVTDVRNEGAKTWSIAVTPLGHRGMKFQPGQFGWLALGRTPFTLQQHPFSFSSSASRNAQIEFTIRELGDFTSQTGRIRPGTFAFIEGPYGSFVPDLDCTDGLVLIAGGVGVAPMMSILRTLSDRADRPQVVMIYGNHNPDEVVFRNELNDLTNKLNLRVVYEYGHIDSEMLQKHLPEGRESYQYFICGPTVMMSGVEGYLNQTGISTGRIHSERFDIA